VNEENKPAERSSDVASNEVDAFECSDCQTTHHGTKGVCPGAEPHDVEREQRMADVTAPEFVEIQIRSDEKVVWVNVDGRCLFRACRIGKLIINDERVK